MTLFCIIAQGRPTDYCPCFDENIPARLGRIPEGSIASGTIFRFAHVLLLGLNSAALAISGRALEKKGEGNVLLFCVDPWVFGECGLQVVQLIHEVPVFPCLHPVPCCRIPQMVQKGLEHLPDLHLQDDLELLRDPEHEGGGKDEYEGRRGKGEKKGEQQKS